MGHGSRPGSGPAPGPAVTWTATRSACPVGPKREPAGAPVAGAGVVVGAVAVEASAVGVPVGPKREPPGAPVAGARVVEVVGAGSGVATWGAVVLAVGAAVGVEVVGAVAGGAEVDEPAAAVTGWETVVEVDAGTRAGVP